MKLFKGGKHYSQKKGVVNINCQTCLRLFDNVLYEAIVKMKSQGEEGEEKRISQIQTSNTS